MDISRKEIEQLLLRHIAEAMSPQEAEKAQKLFSSLNETEFTEMCAAALILNGIIPEGTSLKELWERIRMLDRDGDEKHAVHTLPQEQALDLLHDIDSTEPMGTAVLVSGEQKDLALFCPEGDGPVSVIPADLLLAGTIPAPDIRLEIDQTGHENGEYLRLRVMLFSDFREQIAQADGRNAAVGLVAVYDDTQCVFFVPLGVCAGQPGVLYGDPGFRSVGTEKRILGDPFFTETELREALAAALRIWYGIQYRLLHPADDYLYFYLADCFGLSVPDEPTI